MRVTSLASGSSGNSYLVEGEESAILIDAGIPLRAIEQSLAAVGKSPTQLAALLLTHEHSDHIYAAGALARRYRTPLLGTAGTLEYVPNRTAARQTLKPGERRTIGSFDVTPFTVPHDGSDPVGYLVEEAGIRVCIATDLGHVPGELLPVFEDCDLLILEANHDLQLLWQGPYPRFLKQRVAALTGHLSNEQTADCLVTCAGSRQRAVWLAHLSETNNSPKLALEAVTARLKAEDVRNLTVQVALRGRRSLRWDSAEHMLSQATLF